MTYYMGKCPIYNKSGIVMLPGAAVLKLSVEAMQPNVLILYRKFRKTGWQALLLIADMNGGSVMSFDCESVRGGVNSYLSLISFTESVTL